MKTRIYSRLRLEVMRQALAIDEPITRDDTNIRTASEDVEQSGLNGCSDAEKTCVEREIVSPTTYHLMKKMK